MASRPSTVVWAMTSVTICSVRVAVTTVGCKVRSSFACAKVKKQTQKSHAKNIRKKENMMIDTSQVPSPPSPTVHGRYEATNKRGFTLLAGIRASENNPIRLPSCLFKATSGCVGQDGNTRRYFVRLTVAGAAQAGDRPMPCTKKMYLCDP